MKAPQRKRRSTACPTTTAKTKKSSKPPKPNKPGGFEALVRRYYPGVYSFASRLTDDPRQALLLADHAFNATLKQMANCCDENVFASMLLANVIRASKQLSQAEVDAIKRPASSRSAATTQNCPRDPYLR